MIVDYFSATGSPLDSHRVLMQLRYLLWIPASQVIYSNDIISASCCQEHTT